MLFLLLYWFCLNLHVLPQAAKKSLVVQKGFWGNEKSENEDDGRDWMLLGKEAGGAKNGASHREHFGSYPGWGSSRRVPRLVPLLPLLLLRELDWDCRRFFWRRLFMCFTGMLLKPRRFLRSGSLLGPRCFFPFSLRRRLRSGERPRRLLLRAISCVH